MSLESFPDYPLVAAYWVLASMEADPKIVDCAPALAARLGRGTDHFLDLPLVNGLFPASERERLNIEQAGLDRLGTHYGWGIFPLIQADGSYDYLRATARMSLRDGDNPLLLIQFHEGHAQSMETQEQYRELFERSSDAMLILENSIFVSCNHATIDMLGYASKEEFLNTHPAQLSPEFQPDGMRSADKVLLMNQAAYDNGSHRFEWDHLRSNGEIIPVEVLLVVLSHPDPSVKCLHVVWRDITERRASEAAIASHMAQLQAKNRELEQFTYIVSHDLQEPLRTVTSLVELVQEEHKDTIGDSSANYLKLINNSVARMSRLIKELLTHAKLGSERQLRNVDTQHLVQEVLVDLGAAIQRNGATVDVGALPTLDAYETELRVLFQNLIGNALKFLRPGVAPEIRIAATDEGRAWRFQVQDNGIGIDPKNHDKIFVIFQRLHRASDYSGTGIGLANCKKIVELHGGTITVASVLGEGSTFSFTIPKGL